MSEKHPQREPPLASGAVLDRLMRLPEVMKMTTLGSTKLYELMNCGQFPRSVSIGGRSKAWSAFEVHAWIQAQVAARDAEAA